MIPEPFKQHTATITPLDPVTGVFGTPFSVDCFAELAAEKFDPVDSVVEHSGQLFADPGAHVPIGSKVTVRGYEATVLEFESWDDGSLGLAHRRLDWSTQPFPLQMTIERYTGEDTFDKATNTNTPDFGPVYTGAGRLVQGPWTDNRVQKMGQQSVDYDRVRVAIPWDSPELFPSDRVTVTGGNDPHRVGDVITIDSSAQDVIGFERSYIARINRG